MKEAGHQPDDFMAGLGANERAILERVPTEGLRRFAASVVRTKMKLQFTGWLQYVIPLLPLALLLAISGVALLLGLSRVAGGIGIAAGALLAVVLFDLVTVKFRIRLPERRPPRNDHLSAFDLMRTRRSCRSFQTRLMSDDDRSALFASVQRHVGASTIGATPVRLEYIRERLTVWPTVNGSEFLVAIVPLPYDREAVIDVGRTLQKVVMDATRLGLGTCWIGPGADHESLKRHLGERFDPEREQIICTCAVGYRSLYAPLFVRVFSAMFRRRLTVSELFFSDAGLSTPIDITAPPYARLARTFEACQWAPSSYNGQTTRAVVRTDGAGEVEGVDFCATTTSRYYAPVALGIWCANWELGCDALGLRGRFEPRPVPADQRALPRYDITWRPQ